MTVLRTVRPSERTLYDGRLRLGHVRDLPDAVEAFDSEGESLGRFTSEAGAVSAILQNTAKRTVAGTP